MAHWERDTAYGMKMIVTVGSEGDVQLAVYQPDNGYRGSATLDRESAIALGEALINFARKSNPPGHSTPKEK